MAPKVNKNCKVGDWVRVVFEDHAEGNEHIEFAVFGVVLRKDRRSITVGSFVYHPEFAEVDDNATVYTILRKTIQSVDILQVLPPPTTEVMVLNGE